MIDIEREHQEFETWMKEAGMGHLLHFGVERRDGTVGYVSAGTNHMWNGWIAAKSRTPAGLGEAKAVAYIGRDYDIYYTPNGRGLPSGTRLYAAPVAQAMPVAAEKDTLTKAAGECEMVKRTSDQGLTLQFSSCRAASAFEAAMRVVPPTWKQGGKS